MRFSPCKTRLLLSLNSSPLPAINNNRASEQTTLALLQACNSFLSLTQIQAHILTSGLHNNPLVLTKFTSVSSDLGVIDYASSFIFASKPDTYFYDAFLYNTVIRAYAQTNNYLKHNAVVYYKLMRVCNVLPNEYTYPFLLKGCAGLGVVSLGQQVHGSVLKFGFGMNAQVLNTMVHMYCCCKGGVGFARLVFDEMSKSDPVSWSAMIGGYAKLGMSGDAIELFRKMQVSGVRPDEITMVSVLSACSDLGALELGKWVEGYVDIEKVEKNVELNNALIDMFAKCGDVDKALRVFRGMSEKTVVSWTSVIGGMAMHGRGVEAALLFEEMKSVGVKPDKVAFIGLLTACSHSGLVEEGRRYFYSMTKDFAIVPTIEHYGCMVDLLSRAGLVKEALKFVQRMPLEPNPVIWRTLTAACRVHGELNLGASITEELIRNEPMHEANYVLLSNIYAKMSHWEKKVKIREIMDKKGMRKVPGSTMTELDGKIYEFVSGDRSHVEYKGIHNMIDEMAREMKRAGYVPTTSEVLIDIDEEEA